MNPTHIHLIITHLPIFGTILGTLVLVQGILTKSNMTLIAAYNVLIISAIGAGIAYATGEGAEETVEHIQGISESIIEEHSDSALFSLIGLIVVGVISAVGLVITLLKFSFTKSFAILTLLLSLIAFGVIARTGYLGGQIRHSEIRKNAIKNANQGE